MNDARDGDTTVTGTGTETWVEQTNGRLTPAERRALLLPLVRSYVSNSLHQWAFCRRPPVCEPNGERV